MDEITFWNLVDEIGNNDFEMEPYTVTKPNWTAMTDKATNGQCEIAN